MFQQRHSIETATLASLALVIVINGYSWVQMKVGVKYTAPFDFVALRTSLGTLCLFLVMFGLRKPIWPKEILATFLLGSLQTKDGQSLHNFLRDSPWDVKAIRELRLWPIKAEIGDKPIILCIDETGDKKKEAPPKSD